MPVSYNFLYFHKKTLNYTILIVWHMTYTSIKQLKCTSRLVQMYCS